MLENLTRSGFCFLKSAGENGAIYENKFTGLWILYNFKTDTYKVVEDWNMEKLLEKIRKFLNSEFIRSFARGMNAAHASIWTL